MRFTRTLGVPALALGLLAGSAAPATADPAWSPPEVAWVNENIVTTAGGDQAQLLVKYRCWGVGVHLWGSAKQGPELDPENGRTSSAYAVAWRETPEGPAPTCDGTWRVERVTIEDTPDTQQHEPLAPGRAWMQFAIFAIDPDTFDPETGEGFGRGAQQGWRTVRGEFAR